jgi:hypothetical protein
MTGATKTAFRFPGRIEAFFELQPRPTSCRTPLPNLSRPKSEQRRGAIVLMCNLFNQDFINRAGVGFGRGRTSSPYPSKAMLTQNTISELFSGFVRVFHPVLKKKEAWENAVTVT